MIINKKGDMIKSEISILTPKRNSGPPPPNSEYPYSSLGVVKTLTKT